MTADAPTPDAAPPDAEFIRLIREWQAGSADALAELYTRYSGYLRVVVRQAIDDRLRRQFDSLDFVQDVWASVAAMTAERRTFDSSAALLGFLSRVAKNKLLDTTRSRLTAQSRDVTREQPLPIDPETRDVAIPDPSPSPSQWAIGEEKWAWVLSMVPPGHRVIAERVRDGFTHEEIAQASGVAVRTVERIVRRIKELCET